MSETAGAPASPNLQQLIREDADQRAQACANEVRALLTKYNCTMRTRIVLMPPDLPTAEVVFTALLPGQGT